MLALRSAASRAARIPAPWQRQLLPAQLLPLGVGAAAWARPSRAQSCFRNPVGYEPVRQQTASQAVSTSGDVPAQPAGRVARAAAPNGSAGGERGTSPTGQDLLVSGALKCELGRQ